MNYDLFFHTLTSIHIISCLFSVISFILIFSRMKNPIHKTIGIILFLFIQFYAWYLVYFQWIIHFKPFPLDESIPIEYLSWRNANIKDLGIKASVLHLITMASILILELIRLHKTRNNAVHPVI